MIATFTAKFASVRFYVFDEVASFHFICFFDLVQKKATFEPHSCWCESYVAPGFAALAAIRPLLR